jgi:hypothetical protein
MAEKMVHFSDLSGQMADATTGGLIPLTVTDYPDSGPDQRVRIEVTPDEMDKIGKLAIAAVGLETEPTDEDQKRTRLVVPLAKFATLATRRTDRRSPGERRTGGIAETATTVAG